MLIPSLESLGTYGVNKGVGVGSVSPVVQGGKVKDSCSSLVKTIMQSRRQSYWTDKRKLTKS